MSLSKLEADTIFYGVLVVISVVYMLACIRVESRIPQWLRAIMASIGAASALIFLACGAWCVWLWIGA